MAKFKVGDRVRALQSYLGEFTRGKEYEVTAVNRYSVSVALDDKGSTDNGWGEDNFELVKTKWRPKVGDRVRLVKDGRSTTGAVGKLATIKAWSNGSFVDNGEYLLDIEPPFTYSTAATPANFTRATVDCFELATPTAFTIEAGKFYRTRDGRKVGPILKGEQWPQGPWFFKFADNHFFKDGKSCYGGNGNANRPADDLIAEWVDEPSAAASNDNAPNFKVGDRVRSLVTWCDTMPGDILPVLEVRPNGVWATDRLGDKTFMDNHEIEIVTTPPTPANPAIVALIENGQPKPSDRPYVHADEGAASKEASRLASIHKGKQFGVYILVDTRETDAPSYEHEWKNLAAAGEKINAIKSLRGLTGMGLKPAKDAVEYFLAA